MPAFHLAAVHDGGVDWDSAIPVIIPWSAFRPGPGRPGGVSMPALEPSLDMPRLTLKQRRFYAALCAFIEVYGYPPTLGQLGEQLGLARSTAAYHVAVLQAKGLVQRDGQVVRGIRVTAAPWGHARNELAAIPDGAA